MPQAALSGDRAIPRVLGNTGETGSSFELQQSSIEGPWKYSGNGLKAFNTVTEALKRSAISLTEQAMDSAALEKAIGKRILRRWIIDSVRATKPRKAWGWPAGSPHVVNKAKRGESSLLSHFSIGTPTMLPYSVQLPS